MCLVLKMGVGFNQQGHHCGISVRLLRDDRVLAAVISRRVQEVVAGPRATTGKLNSHYINLETSAKLKRRAVKLSGNTREWCSLKELSGHIPGSRAGKDVVPGAAPLCPDCMHPAECTQALLQH